MSTIAAGIAALIIMSLPLQAGGDRETEEEIVARNIWHAAKLRGVAFRAIAQEDLQHHRWILESIDGTPIDGANLDGKFPELEIDEQMMASGHSGCNQFHGKAALGDDSFIIHSMASTRMFCQAEQNKIESVLLKVLGQESVISIDAHNKLILKSADGLLVFRQQDRSE